MVDHEKLDAYRISVAWVTVLLDEVTGTRRPSALKHLDEASTSVSLNIAEGNGKRLVKRGKLAVENATSGKALLVRIVSMLTKLIETLLNQSSTSTSTSTSTIRR